MRLKKFYCDDCGEVVVVPGPDSQSMEDAKSDHAWDEHGIDTRPPEEKLLQALDEIEVLEVEELWP